MDVHDAAYRVGHDFKPDGAVGLARALGKNPGTFLNQLNPGQEMAKVSLGDAVAMTLAARDYRILLAFASTCDYLVVPKPPKVVGDQALLDIILKRDREIGHFSNAISKALENGEISADEMARIQQEGEEAASAILELVERLRGMCRG